MAGPVNRGFGTSEQQRGQDQGRGGAQTGNQGSGQSGTTAAGMVGAIKDKAQDVASQVASTAGDAWESTRHTAENVASSVTTSAESAFDSMVACMRRNPLASFGAGVGLGILIGMAFLGSSARSSR
jgi:ElaB/YqjD/DUF883 family membrane-anchored ribosome-binding protein